MESGEIPRPLCLVNNITSINPMMAAIKESILDLNNFKLKYLAKNTLFTPNKTMLSGSYFTLRYWHLIVTLIPTYLNTKTL